MSSSSGVYSPAQSSSNGMYQFAIEGESPAPDSRFTKLPREMIESIVQFLSVKDRFSFKQTNRLGRDTSASVEISLLREAFSKDAVYLNQILKPKSSELEGTFDHLQAATRHAETVAKKSTAAGAVNEEIRPRVIYRILPDTYKAFQSAIQSIKTEDEHLVEFYSQSFPDLVIESDEPQAVSMRRRAQNEPHLHELTLEAVERIKKTTPAEIVAFRMSNEVLIKLFEKLFRENNRPALFALMESRRLEAIAEFDPEFVRLKLEVLKSIFNLAAEADQVKAVEAILDLAGHKISYQVWGSAEDSANFEGAKNAAKAIQERARATRMSCGNRCCYRLGKSTRILAATALIALVGALIGIMIDIANNDKQRNAYP